MIKMKKKYWLGVVSKEHVLRGIEGNYVQVCHGKKAPLQRMQAGDGFVYYSPVVTFGGKDKLQAFTAIGTVKPGETYQVEMFENFKPFRKDVEFIKDFKEAPIDSLKKKLSLTQGNWGMTIRRGHLEISEEDFTKIANAMGVDFKKTDKKSTETPSKVEIKNVTSHSKFFDEKKSSNNKRKQEKVEKETEELEIVSKKSNVSKFTNK